MCPVAKETSAPRDPIPEGPHPAVCYGVIDLGTQQPLRGSRFAKTERKVLLMWEIPGERYEIEIDGQKQDLPRVLTKEFTLSLSEKANLRKFLEAWRSKKFTEAERAGFELAVLAGMPCMLNVVHKDNGYEDIASCMRMPKGMAAMSAEREIIVYDIDKPIPQSLPEWIRRKIAASDEHQQAEQNGGHPPPPSGAFDDSDDIPFIRNECEVATTRGNRHMRWLRW